MGFESVRLYQFRNMHDGVVDLNAPHVFLVGTNGQGKSNFLEALYMLSYGGSFRTRRDQEVCRSGTNEMALSGTYSASGETVRVDVRYQEGRKTIRIDEVSVQDRRDLVSRIPSVIFRHDDMAFVNGSPDMQRWFVDQTLSMNHPLYIDDMRRYRRILRNRNQLIKDNNLELLPAYDRELAEQGLEIQRRRAEVLEAFNAVFSQEFRAIACLTEDLHLVYRPSWRNIDSAEDVGKHLLKHRAQEVALRTTTSGPHRDRIVFRYGDTDFLTVASTGQVRLVALILRVAQARFFAERSEKLPVLLLDDVLLELDHQRRERFVERLPEAEQKVFTFLPGEPYTGYRNEATVVYGVSDGVLKRE